MAVYSHIYPYMHCKCTQIIQAIDLQYIHTQEASSNSYSATQ